MKVIVNTMNKQADYFDHTRYSILIGILVKANKSIDEKNRVVRKPRPISATAYLQPHYADVYFSYRSDQKLFIATALSIAIK